MGELSPLLESEKMATADVIRLTSSAAQRPQIYNTKPLIKAGNVEFQRHLSGWEDNEGIVVSRVFLVRHLLTMPKPTVATGHNPL